MSEIIPRLVNLLSFITVFSMMTSIGTTITAKMCLDHLRTPLPLILGLLSVLVRRWSRGKTH